MNKRSKSNKKREIYKRLSLQERYALENGIRANKSMSSMARSISRPTKTVCLEIKRNGGYLRYYAQKAHEKQAKSNRAGYSKIRANSKLENYIGNNLKEKWSPEVIAGRWNRENSTLKISSEAIYQWIYKQDDDLYLLLPRKRKKRGQRTQRISKSTIPNRISIHERPRAINNRSLPGHFEGDLVFQQGNKSQNILSLIERKSRFIMLKKNESKNSDVVMAAAQDAFSKSKYPVYSITLDNGTEFTNHDKLGIDVYFCDPASPWQKPAVENLNGILRRYLDYTIDAKSVTQEMIDEISHMINNKPRKILKFLTPYEVIGKLYKQKSEGVTFQN